MLHRPVSALIAAAAFAMPLISNAASYTYTFSGSVSNLYPSLQGSFQNGESITGTFQVESTDSNPDPHSGYYVANNLNVLIGENYYITGNLGGAYIYYNLFDTINALNVVFTGPGNLIGSPINGMAPEYFDIQFDFDVLALSSDALPNLVPINHVWLDRSNINFPDDANRLSFTVTNLSAVPEPESLSLLLTGLGLVFIRAQKKNRAT